MRKPIALLLLFSLVAARETSSQAAHRWSLRLDKDIRFFEVTPLGSLLVVTENSLAGVNAGTGAIVWERKDLKEIRDGDLTIVPLSQLAIINVDKSRMSSARVAELIDLQTGTTKWSARDLGFKESRGFLLVPEQRMILLYGDRKEGGDGFVAVDLETGTPKWASPKKWLEQDVVELETKVGEEKVKGVGGHQPPLVDSDTSAIVFLSGEGLAKVDLRNGQRLWWAKVGADRPPARQWGFAPPLLNKGVLYVPFDRKLQAVRATDGTVLWKKARELKSKVVQLEMDGANLVVRGAAVPEDDGDKEGDAFLDVLDPATGASRWKKQFRDLDQSTPFLLKDGQIHLVSDGQLRRIRIADGVAKTLLKLKLKGDERAQLLEWRPAGLLVRSSQNVLLVTPAGTASWQAYHESPGPGGLAKPAAATTDLAPTPTAAQMIGDHAVLPASARKLPLVAANAALAARVAAASAPGASIYILTRVNQGDESGPGILKVSKDTGKEQSAIVLKEKKPVFRIDDLGNKLFFRRSDRDIVAYSF